MGFMDHFYKAVDLEEVPESGGSRGGKRGRGSVPPREADRYPYASRGEDVPYYQPREPQYRQEAEEIPPAFQRESENTYVRQPLTHRPTTLSEVLVYAPKSYDDVQGLIDYLTKGTPLIVDLADIRNSTAQRILDFLAGAIYAVGGDMMPLHGGLFLLTPEGVNISN